MNTPSGTGESTSSSPLPIQQPMPSQPLPNQPAGGEPALNSAAPSQPAPGSLASGSPAPGRTLSAVEQRGIEPVPRSEQTGNPWQLFWVWFAANISVLGLPLGVSLVAMGLNVWQAMLAAVLGACGSFAVVGIISVAGSRGGAPSLTLSRAVFGVRGNLGPTLMALLSRLGWETVNTSTAALAFVTFCSLVFGTPGTARQTPLLAVVGVLLFVLLTMIISGLGINAINEVQKWSTWIFGALNLVILVYLLTRIDWAGVLSLEGGSVAQVIAGIGVIAAGTGIGWSTSGADMARYQSPLVRAGHLVASAAAGAGIPLIIMISMGAVIGSSSPAVLASPNPMDTIRESLPTAAAAIYLFISFVGLLLSNHLSVYSAGLNWITMGVRIKRTTAVLIEIAITTVLALVFLLAAENFYDPFIAFISVLALPLSAWTAVFLVDMIKRRSYKRDSLLDLTPASPYWYRGGVRWRAFAAWIIGTVVAFLFIEIQWSGSGGETTGAAQSVQEILFVGPLAHTWIGEAGLGWLVAGVVAAVVFLLCGGLRDHDAVDTAPATTAEN